METKELDFYLDNFPIFNKDQGTFHSKTHHPPYPSSITKKPTHVASHTKQATTQQYPASYNASPQSTPKKLKTFSHKDAALFQKWIETSTSNTQPIPDKDACTQETKPWIYPPLRRSAHISINQTLDLHGYTVSSASRAVKKCIEESCQRGFTVILIIHGRGNHSDPEKPKLRTYIRHWLMHTGKIWVYRAEKAPKNRGGDGATLVWLRQFPQTNMVP